MRELHLSKYEPGGKGANQAVAAARLGGNVTFICKTGNDVFGKQSAELFKNEGIDTSLLLSDATHPSGVALITVDKHGENTIAVASGRRHGLLDICQPPAFECVSLR